MTDREFSESCAVDRTREEFVETRRVGDRIRHVYTDGVREYYLVDDDPVFIRRLTAPTPLSTDSAG
jgi:hypothetical protein